MKCEYFRSNCRKPQNYVETQLSHMIDMDLAFDDG